MSGVGAINICSRGLKTCDNHSFATLLSCCGAHLENNQMYKSWIISLADRAWCLSGEQE